MQRHFNAEPSDYYNAFMYGTVNDRMGNLDESVRVWTLLDSIYPSKLEPAFKLADALSARRALAARLHHARLQLSQHHPHRALPWRHGFDATRERLDELSHPPVGSRRGFYR